MKNLTGLMKQAQQMQQRMADLQTKLDAAEIEGVSGAGLVRITLSGKGAMKRIVIDPKLVSTAETEMLEDLILAAHGDAKSKLDQMTEVEMKDATGGMSLPSGFKLPF
jgi:DNA-binding YbaB/EbfC family protein